MSMNALTHLPRTVPVRRTTAFEKLQGHHIRVVAFGVSVASWGGIIFFLKFS